MPGAKRCSDGYPGQMAAAPAQDFGKVDVAEAPITSRTQKPRSQSAAIRLVMGQQNASSIDEKRSVWCVAAAGYGFTSAEHDGWAFEERTDLFNSKASSRRQCSTI